MEVKAEVREKKADTPVHTPSGGDALPLSDESEELDQKTFSVVSLWRLTEWFYFRWTILRLKPYLHFVEGVTK